jgi:hypothetical protein
MIKREASQGDDSAVAGDKNGEEGSTPKPEQRRPRDPYMTPEFTKLLLDHMHRAKIAALRDARETK